jgi:lipid-A-disaccharide synthase
MKLYFIAGEASGDLHGSNLLKQLKAQQPNVELRGWGGDLMQAEGMHVVKHIRDLAFMGFAEVVANLSSILSNFKLCKYDIMSYKPDAVVLIDYPGFNLRMAKFCKKRGIKVFYYISPQVWAWKKNRVHKIKKYVDEMFVILPFEKDFYKQFDYEVHYVGHPLIDAINQFKELPEANLKLRTDKPIIALLPGSRKQEIAAMLPLMLKVTSKYLDYQIVVAGAPNRDEDFYKIFLKEFPKVDVVFGQTYTLLSKATAALVTSGTATLETALFNVPQVVCYKGNKLSFQIAKRLVDIKFISLVNLILDKEVVRELIQDEFNEAYLIVELDAILPKGNKRSSILTAYQTLHQLLGDGGASEKVARLMLKTLQQAV